MNAMADLPIVCEYRGRIIPDKAKIQEAKSGTKESVHNVRAMRHAGRYKYWNFGLA